MDLVNEPMRSQQGNEYEVLLSFNRGEETPESFPSSLYSSLRENGFSVFKDDISIELLQSAKTEGPKVFIVIFSRHYASSVMRMKELTKIMDFRSPCDHVVLPIFYDVYWFEVCNQTSSFGEAFEDLIQRISPTENEELRWRTALSEAGGNYGFFVPNFKSSNESEVIQNIVHRVHYVLKRKCPFAAEGLVAVRSQVQEVITMLHKHRSKDVVTVGIWGMTGIGKTTIAKLIFDHLQYEFEISRCCLSNFKEAWERKGNAYFQNELLPLISRATDARIGGFESASHKPTARRWHKKVLFVFGDVTHMDQLRALRESREHFGQGSRIIITAIS